MRTRPVGAENMAECPAMWNCPTRHPRQFWRPAELSRHRMQCMHAMHTESARTRYKHWPCLLSSWRIRCFLSLVFRYFLCLFRWPENYKASKSGLHPLGESSRQSIQPGNHAGKPITSCRDRRMQPVGARNMAERPAMSNCLTRHQGNPYGLLNCQGIASCMHN